MNNKVWTYWEGDRPAYIDYCFQSMQKYCPNLTILTPATVLPYIRDLLHPNWQKLTRAAHRADVIRVAIMKKYGGTWVDADTVFIRPFENFLRKEIDCDFGYCKWDDGRVLNGYFYAKENSEIMKDWLLQINKILFQLQSGVSWTSFGESIISPLVFGKFANMCTEIDRATFLPVNIDRIPYVFLEPLHVEAFIRENTVAVGLNHSWFVDNVPNFLAMSVQDIQYSNTLLGSIFANEVA